MRDELAERDGLDAPAMGGHDMTDHQHEGCNELFFF
jgi:hypothetical protein